MLLPVDAISAQACLLQLHMLGDLDFDVNVASLSRDKDLLERAKMAYNAGSGSTPSQNNGLASLFARMCRCTDICVFALLFSGHQQRQQQPVKGNKGFGKQGRSQPQGNRSGNSGKAGIAYSHCLAGSCSRVCVACRRAWPEKAALLWTSTAAAAAAATMEEAARLQQQVRHVRVFQSPLHVRAVASRRY